MIPLKLTFVLTSIDVGLESEPIDMLQSDNVGDLCHDLPTYMSIRFKSTLMFHNLTCWFDKGPVHVCFVIHLGRHRAESMQLIND